MVLYGLKILNFLSFTQLIILLNYKYFIILGFVNFIIIIDQNMVDLIKVSFINCCNFLVVNNYYHEQNVKYH